MRKPSGVIFDFGNTVMDETTPFNPIAGNSRLLRFAKGPVRLTAEEIQVVADEMNAEIDRIRTQSMIEFSVQAFQRSLFERLGMTFTIGYTEMEREFWRGAVVHEPADGISEVLDVLESNRVKTGIVSNVSFRGDVLIEDLAKYDLAHRFSFVISSADYGFRKPHRHIFDVAARRMGLPAEDIWFVGDRLDCDVQGAAGAGLFPVWYNPSHRLSNGCPVGLEVAHWDEFRDKILALCHG